MVGYGRVATHPRNVLQADDAAETPRVLSPRERADRVRVGPAVFGTARPRRRDALLLADLALENRRSRLDRTDAHLAVRLPRGSVGWRSADRRDWRRPLGRDLGRRRCGLAAPFLPHGPDAGGRCHMR